MSRLLLLFCLLSLILTALTFAVALERDLQSDTWVAVDSLGRALPIGGTDCPLPREDRTVLIFYFLWQGQHSKTGPFDISKLLAENPTNPQLGPVHDFHHWGEAELGYYVQPDEFLYRRHAQMLSDAGIDVLSCDVTNDVTYQDCYMKLLETFTQMNEEGNKTPKISFLTNTNHARVSQELYDVFYAKNLYPQHWFYWQGKPLLLANSKDQSQTVLDYFTLKQSWAWTKGHSWFGNGKNKWAWLDHYPQNPGWSESRSIPEQIVVCAGQHPVSNIGRSFHDGKEPTEEERTVEMKAQGLCFAEQWKRALEVDPRVVFITGWNEWVAMRFLIPENGEGPGMLGKTLKPGDSFFVDLYDDEFNRDIEPMQGGSGDTLYYQMVGNIRKYKGARPIPKGSAPCNIVVDGDFGDWNEVGPDFFDSSCDTTHRNSLGWGSTGPYVDTLGRNDFVSSKVARDRKSVYFMVETREPIVLPSTNKQNQDQNQTQNQDRDNDQNRDTSGTGLYLLVNSDQDYSTGYNGYDWIVEINSLDSDCAELFSLSKEGTKGTSVSIPLKIVGNRLELGIDRSVLGLLVDPISFDFHWIDNFEAGYVFDSKLGQVGEATRGNGLGHPGFPLHGDSAPNRRFNYRYIGE
ncbi:MAG: hypothetical protein ACRC10_03750 [Thermoguttaceae bacterium]